MKTCPMKSKVELLLFILLTATMSITSKLLITSSEPSTAAPVLSLNSENPRLHSSIETGELFPLDAIYDEAFFKYFMKYLEDDLLIESLKNFCIATIQSPRLIEDYYDSGKYLLKENYFNIKNIFSNGNSKKLEICNDLDYKIAKANLNIYLSALREFVFEMIVSDTIDSIEANPIIYNNLKKGYNDENLAFNSNNFNPGIYDAIKNENFKKLLKRLEDKEKYNITEAFEEVFLKLKKFEHDFVIILVRSFNSRWEIENFFTKIVDSLKKYRNKATIF
jgi:hypothetical protein